MTRERRRATEVTGAAACSARLAAPVPLGRWRSDLSRIRPGEDDDWGSLLAPLCPRLIVVLKTIFLRGGGLGSGERRSVILAPVRLLEDCVLVFFLPLTGGAGRVEGGAKNHEGGKESLSVRLVFTSKGFNGLDGVAGRLRFDALAWLVASSPVGPLPETGWGLFDFHCPVEGGGVDFPLATLLEDDN